jgi:hypothetical protein
MTNAFNYVESGNQDEFQKNLLRSNETYPYTAKSGTCDNNAGNTAVHISGSKAIDFLNDGSDRAEVLR